MKPKGILCGECGAQITEPGWCRQCYPNLVPADTREHCDEARGTVRGKW
jgi:hypothetical protein